MSELPETVRFMQRSLDANGDRLGPLDDAGGFDAACDIIWRRTGETVMQARLQGQSPAVIRVWSNASTRAVDNAWWARDRRTGRLFNILSPGEPAEDRAYVEFLASADASP